MEIIKLFSIHQNFKLIDLQAFYLYTIFPKP